MSDTFGLLELPAPAVGDGEAVTDPALDMLLAFMKAVLNSDLGTAWADVSPADTTPVAYVFNHNPDIESINVDETPALYAWRSDSNDVAKHYSQDYVADEGGFTCLWVPPPMPQESKRAREAIRNGIKKALKAAFAQGRHPAWVIAGDTYYEPQIYGSVLLKHTRLARCKLGQFKAHALIIDFEDGSGKIPIECLMFTLDTLEFWQKDTSVYDALDHLEGTVKLPARADQTSALSVMSVGETLTYHVEFSLTSIDVASGPSEGGTTVTITGTQFIEGMSVLFGTAEVPEEDVTYVDETTLEVITPAHDAGTVDITVVQAAGGMEKTLSSVFTFYDRILTEAGDALVTEAGDLLVA